MRTAQPRTSPRMTARESPGQRPASKRNSPPIFRLAGCVGSLTRTWSASRSELELRRQLDAGQVAGPAVLQPALLPVELDAEVRLRHRAPDQVRVDRVGLHEQ